jgi:hypothetical protein
VPTDVPVVLLLVACTGTCYPCTTRTSTISSYPPILISYSQLLVYNPLFLFSSSSDVSSSLQNAFVACWRAYPAFTNPTYIPEPPATPCKSASRPQPKWTTETHPWFHPLLSMSRQSYPGSHILFLPKSACQRPPESRPFAKAPIQAIFFVWSRAPRE